MRTLAAKPSSSADFEYFGHHVVIIPRQMIHSKISFVNTLIKFSYSEVTRLSFSRVSVLTTPTGVPGAATTACLRARLLNLILVHCQTTVPNTSITPARGTRKLLPNKV